MGLIILFRGGYIRFQLIWFRKFLDTASKYMDVPIALAATKIEVGKQCVTQPLIVACRLARL